MEGGLISGLISLNISEVLGSDLGSGAKLGWEALSSHLLLDRAVINLFEILFFYEVSHV